VPDRTGLFAERAFAADELITRFSGQAMTRREGQAITDPSLAERVAFIDGRAILGTLASELQPHEGAGSAAILVDDPALANANRSRLAVPKGDPRYGLWLRATRAIAPGDEIVAFAKRYPRAGREDEDAADCADQ
jgi:hypothetical protein